ncbi:MAG: hypothetical protein COB30_005690 [Ectothiorhodospiraceae bacterium]|nr:hypothetical protein [Ectothiorhodospiraceae bacterium]
MKFLSQWYASPVLLVLLTMVVMTGCASNTPAPQKAGKIYWPKAPATPRYEYVTTLRSGADIRPLSREDVFRKALTGLDGKKTVLAKPYGVAAKDGMVVVTDTLSRGGFIFNLPRQKLYPFGRVGKEGVLSKPMGVAIGSDSQIYVADVSAKRVQVYDAYGMHLQTIGNAGDFDRPVGVSVSPDGNTVYIVDAGGIDSIRHRVLIYDKNGVKKGEFGRRGEQLGEFNLPTQVAVAPNGTVFVLDAGNFRVQSFTANGEFQHAWGKVGRNFGEFARPKSLAIDASGNVYVTDAAFRNIQVFNAKGQLLLAIGGETSGDKPGEYALPAGVAIDELGHVYVVDQVYAKVDVLKLLTEQEMEKVVSERSTQK